MLERQGKSSNVLYVFLQLCVLILEPYCRVCVVCMTLVDLWFYYGLDIGEGGVVYMNDHCNIRNQNVKDTQNIS